MSCMLRCTSAVSTILLSFFSSFSLDFASTAEIYPLSLHDALPIWPAIMSREPPWSSSAPRSRWPSSSGPRIFFTARSEEHTSELQSLRHLVCRLLLEKKKKDDNRLKSGRACQQRVDAH